jgi:hypothetical protein
VGLALSAALALGACRKRPTHFTWTRTPAYGRPSSCPDDAVDLGPGTRDRCSYADADRDLVQVRGKLVQEMPGTLPIGIADAEVRLVRIADDGSESPALARTTTDAQGSFSLRAYARPGEYALVSGDARTSVLVAKKGPRTFADVQLLIPAAP